MDSFVQKYSDIWGDNPLTLLNEYTYQPVLTEKLDKLADQPETLTTEVFYEIVLWKLSRFPHITPDLLESVKKVSAISSGNHSEGKSQLRELLQTPGIGLPMASTVLRFMNPSTFQIIDDRMYRIVHPGKAKYPPKPPEVTDKYLETCETIYFEYLDELRKLSSENAELPFEQLDRVLYQLDKKLGNQIGD